MIRSRSFSPVSQPSYLHESFSILRIPSLNIQGTKTRCKTTVRPCKRAGRATWPVSQRANPQAPEQSTVRRFNSYTVTVARIHCDAGITASVLLTNYLPTFIFTPQAFVLPLLGNQATFGHPPYLLSLPRLFRPSDQTCASTR